MTVRAVLFDLDGVLIHSKPAWFAMIRALAIELGYPPPDAAAFDRMWGQGIGVDRDTLFTEQSVDELSALYAARFSDHLDAVDVDPEGAPLFADLRARGLGIAIVTNTPRPLADRLVAHAGLQPDVLVGGTDTERAKPAPDPLLAACRQLDVDPSEAMMVGDTDADRGAAQAAGIRFVGVGGIDGDLTLGTLAELRDVWGP